MQQAAGTAEELTKLADLRDRGREFANAKAKLLGPRPQATASPSADQRTPIG